MKKKYRIVLSVLLVSMIFSGCEISFRAGIVKHENEEVAVNSEVEVMEKDLEVFIEALKEVNDTFGVITLMDQYIKESERDIVYMYYGTSDGEFIAVPDMELPSDYNFVERPPYKIAAEGGTYKPEPYLDVKANKQMQSITKAVVVDGNVIGVAGIDFYID